MSTQNKIELLDCLSDISKEDLVIALLAKGKISEQELTDLIETQRQKKKELVSELIPLSIFLTKLFPLEALTRYLRENKQKKNNEIAKILHKRPASISEAYKNSKNKKFKVKATKFYLPLAEFQKHPNFSVLEVIINHLIGEGFKLTAIAKLLDKSPKTIWTINSRIKKKK